MFLHDYHLACDISTVRTLALRVLAFSGRNLFNEEQIISGCPIDGAISVWVDGGFGSYR